MIKLNLSFQEILFIYYALNEYSHNATLSDIDKTILDYFIEDIVGIIDNYNVKGD